MTQFDRRNFLTLAGAAGLLPFADIAFAADWPDRPVTVISPYPAGGGTDTVTRLVAEVLKTAFNGNFVVDNRPGAAGAIGGGLVARAKPDGYTILVSASSPLAAAKLVQTDLTYDPQTDFTPISLVSETPLGLYAHPSLGVTNVQDLIKYAKANPGKLRCGNPGTGAKGHIAAAILARQAGIDIIHVPYKGTSGVSADLLGGHIPLAMDTLSTYLPYIEEKKIHCLGVTSAKRVPKLPDTRTIAEQGLDGYEATLWTGVVGPKGMPDDIVMKMSNAIKDWVNSPAGKEKLASMSIEPLGGSPADLKRAQDLEINSLRPIVESGALNEK